ncbi:hypothetical protein V9T40_009363 [Parthenolecanium corni]|uniref:Uncharacterized protein n=1 Tax=Parthenolecanium corni TaxID=536013 RepID=A0AAN9Y8Q1_9HEMI
MTLISPKAGDIEKIATSPTKAVLFTYDYTDELKSVPLESPVKVSPKAAVPLPKVTESSAAVKTNGLV